MSLTLPDRPAKHFIKQVLVPGWDKTETLGYDADAARGTEAFIPIATTIDDVGAVYPSLVVQYSNETSGGESTYDFITPDGPGQDRNGTLLVTARAEDREGKDGYTGDSATYDAEPAEDVVVQLVEAVEAICQRNALGGQSAFDTIGSQRGPDAPDDDEKDPTVRLANTQVLYTYRREP